MFIRSERLFLRPAWPEDWEELHPLVADEGLVRNLARAPWPYTADDAREFVARKQDKLLPNFLVTLPSAKGSRIIGSAGLAADGGQVELGYWIARGDWGRGYATEAARAVLRVAAALGHRRIVAGHFVDNPASGRVLVKAGFRPTGDLRSKFSRARARNVPSLAYEIELAGCCGGGDDGGEEDRRMAA